MLYEDVFEHLEREGVAYVVVGGFALVLRGLRRETGDLDLAVDCAGDGAERAARALAGAGFFPTVPLPLSLVMVWRTLDRGGRRVDVFTRHFIPFAELVEGSTRVAVGATHVRVASAAHVALASQIVGRPAKKTRAESDA